MVLASERLRINVVTMSDFLPAAENSKGRSALSAIKPADLALYLHSFTSIIDQTSPANGIRGAKFVVVFGFLDHLHRDTKIHRS